MTIWVRCSWARPGRPLIWGVAALLIAATPAAGQVFEVGLDGVMQSPGASVGTMADDVEAAPEVPDGAVTMPSDLAAPAAYRDLVLRAAADAHVSPDLLAALVWQESRWHADAVSAKGARGLGQLMPATAASLAVDPHDPGSNLAGAAAYLRQLLDRFDGNVEKALAAYNAGPGRVARANGVPAIAETRAYVAAISGRLSAQAVGAQ